MAAKAQMPSIAPRVFTRHIHPSDGNHQHNGAGKAGGQDEGDFESRFPHHYAARFSAPQRIDEVLGRAGKIQIVTADRPR